MTAVPIVTAWAEGVAEAPSAVVVESDHPYVTLRHPGTGFRLDSNEAYLLGAALLEAALEVEA